MTPEQHAIVLAALETVAPEEPINQDEQGGCVWCGGTPPGEMYGYATSDRTHHDKDCGWVLAREAIAIMRKAAEPTGKESLHVQISNAEIMEIAKPFIRNVGDYASEEPAIPCDGAIEAFARALLEKAR